jgi:hypothetical protein
MLLTYILLTAAEELMLLSRCEMEVLESSNKCIYYYNTCIWKGTLKICDN